MQGTHLAHPPDFELALRKTTFTQRKSKLLAKHYPELLAATQAFLNNPVVLEPNFSSAETDPVPVGVASDSEDNMASSSAAITVKYRDY